SRPSIWSSTPRRSPNSAPTTCHTRSRATDEGGPSFRIHTPHASDILLSCGSYVGRPADSGGASGDHTASLGPGPGLRSRLHVRPLVWGISRGPCFDFA